MSSKNSPPLTPRTTSFQVRVTNQFETLQRQMEQLITQYNRRSHSESSDHRSERRRRRPRVARRGERRHGDGDHGGRGREDRVEGIKVQIPSLVGMNDPETYLESQTEASKEEENQGSVFMLEGDLLMVRRLLGSQIKEHEENQRENIFHSRCLVKGNVCSLIIDGGSCANVVSTRLVSKLNLVTKAHPTPYRLQWLSEVGEMIVNQQTEVPFSIGKYEDTILCDVVTMEASHILLGRPWQYDKKTIHDGFSNKYTFMHQNHKMVLAPLSPKQVCKDQKSLKQKIEEEKKESKKKMKKRKKRKKKKRRKKRKKKKRTFWQQKVRSSIL